MCLHQTKKSNEDYNLIINSTSEDAGLTDRETIIDIIGSMYTEEDIIDLLKITSYDLVEAFIEAIEKNLDLFEDAYAELTNGVDQGYWQIDEEEVFDEP